MPDSNIGMDVASERPRHEKIPHFARFKSDSSNPCKLGNGVSHQLCNNLKSLCVKPAFNIQYPTTQKNSDLVSKHENHRIQAKVS